uniref:Flagellar protein FlgA n=1 Tax=Aeromonas sp. Ne-1 TaxID=1675689 RepID=A0A0H4JD08_9GAMM|nr:flagellar protein FlgA [Aeromonas sp. Ne-1]
MKKYFKIISAILFLVLGVGILFGWEFYFKDKIDTVEVIVAKQDITFKDKLTADNLEVKSIRRENAISNYLTPNDVDVVLNKYAAIDIKKGTQLYSKLVDTYNLIPNEKKGEFVAPIPDEWLFAVPGSLRKAFIADFYAIPDEEQQVIQSIVASDSEDENDSEDKKLTEEQVSNLVSKDNKPILQNIRVSSVKDGTNGEVKESTEDTEQATGEISTLEIIANDEILSTLQEYTSNGYKLYVVYRYER